MGSLLQLFFDIAAWRRGPQDLPVSPALLTVCTAIYVVTSYAQLRLRGFPLGSATIMAAVDIAMMAGATALILILANKQPRWLQTMTALVGVGVLLGLLDVAVRLLMFAAGATEESQFWLVVQGVVFFAVFGRIFQHALETGLLAGIALTFLLSIATTLVSAMFVPIAPPTAAGG